MRLLPYVLVIGLAIYAWIDLSRSTPSDRAGLNPAAWAAIILVPGLGPAAWLLVSRYQRGVIGAPPGVAAAKRRAAPPPPRARRDRPSWPPHRRGAGAPDDDPDFLRGLDGDRPRGRDDGGPAPD